MKLICKLCNLEVSKELTELKDKSLLNKNDGEDYIPEGFYMIVKENDTYFPPRERGCIIINLKDLINTKYHKEQRRLLGCCGCDGGNGMNRTCLCKNEIGTESSDCWMAHLVALNPEKVKFM